ncbi:neprilysin-1-like [Saccoglossus kowalevskii]
MDPIYLVVVICLVIEFTDVNGRTSEDVALDMETRDLGLAQVMTARMDTTVEPCVDFYQFTCGNWIESHDIPASQSRFDMFKQLKLNVSKTIMDSVEKTITDNDIKPIVDAKNYYQSCIDLDGIDNVGKAPLTRLLESLGGWPVLGDNPGGRWNASHYKLESLLSLMLREIGNSLLFSTHVSTETMQPSRRVIQVINECTF